jgi:hypothetical protein
MDAIAHRHPQGRRMIAVSTAASVSKKIMTAMERAGGDSGDDGVLTSSFRESQRERCRMSYGAWDVAREFADDPREDRDTQRSEPEARGSEETTDVRIAGM